jgi:hypothetical protein
MPDYQDFKAVENSPGDDPTKYRLAQANKLIRLYENGQLPLELMRALDAIRVQNWTRAPGG